MAVMYQKLLKTESESCYFSIQIMHLNKIIKCETTQSVGEVVAPYIPEGFLVKELGMCTSGTQISTKTVVDTNTPLHVVMGLCPGYKHIVVELSKKDDDPPLPPPESNVFTVLMSCGRKKDYLPHPRQEYLPFFM